MTEQLARPSGPELLEVHHIRLREAPAPAMPPACRAAMDQAWDEAVRANPSLFDGPTAVCAGAEREEPYGLVVSWVRTTYRQFILRRIPGATGWLPSLFVSVVQPTDDGRLLVGRMSATTSAPGRWQLPGGTLEPPEEHEQLDADALRRHAARELAEETGIDTPADDLTLWRVVRCRNGNVGALYLAPARPASEPAEHYAALVSTETALGQDPEFDRIALIGSGAESEALDGAKAEYLEAVVSRYAQDLGLSGLSRK